MASLLLLAFNRRSVEPGFDYCFALDFTVEYRQEGQARVTRITRYAYLPLHRGMDRARFDFGASPRDDRERDDAFMPQAVPVYFRLCAAPPPASHLSPAPLGGALGKMVIFG